MTTDEKLAKQLKVIDYKVYTEEIYDVTKVLFTRNISDISRISIELLFPKDFVSTIIENFCNGKWDNKSIEHIMRATGKVDIVRATRLESESDTNQNIDKIYGNADIEIFNTVDGNFMNILVSNNDGKCISFMLKSDN